MAEPIFLIGTALLAVLAYANGSNDVSKGIATLVGSGVADYKKAILWGTVWTIMGGLLAAFFSKVMIQTFTNGILSNGAGGLDKSPLLYLAVMAGTFGWVITASQLGLPVSTTHALIGALCGAGIASMGWDGINWISLLKKVLIPLALSPFLALGIVFILSPAIRRSLAGWKGHCICLLPVQKAGLVMEQSGLIRVIPGETGFATIVDSPQCSDPRVLAMRIGTDTCHWITSGFTSLARGLNDAPKIVVLFVGLNLLNGGGLSIILILAFAIVSLGMGFGSYHGGHKVTEVLAKKVTRMDHLEGFSANLTTASLVALAARFGLPVSTTHVSTGAIVGMGLISGAKQVNWKIVLEMILAWALTLPISGLISAVCWLIFRWF